MKAQKLFLPCFLFLFYCLDVEAQPRPSIHQITEEDGLSYRWVFDIIQDQKGFIWLATYDGLNRYDGKSFISYKHSLNDSNSISSSKVAYIAEDQQGAIWTYGQDLKFNRIDLATGQATKTNTYIKNGETESGIVRNMQHFGSLRNGDFIVLFQEKDLKECSFWKYDPEANVFKHLVDIPTPPGTIDYFSERPDGKIWLWGMGVGYYLIDLKKAQFDVYPVNSIGLKTPLKVDLPIDHNRDFWYPAYTDTESLLTNTDPLLSFTIPSQIDIKAIDNLRLDNLGNIWFNHKEDELYHYDRRKRKLEMYQDPIFGQAKDHRSMNRFFVDQEGSFWNGYFYGAYKFSPQPKLFRTYLDVAKDNTNEMNGFSARQILEISPDTLLVKNHNHDLFLINLKTGAHKTIQTRHDSALDQPVSKGMLSMFIGRDGYLWGNTNDKIIRTDLTTGISVSYNIRSYDIIKKYDPNDELPRIFEDASGKIWFCSKEGLSLFDKKNKALIPADIQEAYWSVNPSFNYSSYDEDADAIYGTYDQGVYILHCKDQKVSLVEIFSKSESDFIPTAILYWNNEFWLSTGKGLVQFNPATRSRKIYTQRDGFPSDLVYSAIGGKNDLWVATHNGLCQLNPYANKLTTYYEEDGLPHNEFNRWSYLKTKNGQMYFGGLNGVIGFNPDDFAIPNNTIGQLHLLSYTKYNQRKDTLLITGEPFEENEEIILGAEERSITFNYALTVFSDVKKNQYFHYLEGLEPTWIEDGNLSEARYSQIPPGQYTFRVKAAGPRNHSAVNELAIPIMVKQYWYLRDWAKAIYFIIALFLIVAFYRFQLNQKLAKQEALATKAMGELKTKMYTNITHEFRTPLTVMLGMNDVIKHDLHKHKTEDAFKAINLIERNGKNLLSLVNQMLDLTKIESGLLRVHKIQGDIIAYLKYRLEAFEIFAKEKEIDILFKSGEDQLMMDFDAEKISQIINNLISNAIKFSPEQGIIEVRAEKKRDQNGIAYFALHVTDSGIGIAPDQLDSIFDRFYRVGNKENEKNKGTGIGLSLVRELVHLLGGTLSVKSTLQQGSTFSIQLPITNKEAFDKLSDYEPDFVLQEMATSLPADPIELSHELIEGQALILIVEDNADVRQYINLCLQEDHNTVLVENGSEGIEKAIELIPDIIITDVMMPVKDGYALCSFIKHDERTSHIPIIMLTSKADDESKIKGLEYGADVYLAKPFNRIELLLRIKNLLSLRRELQKKYASPDYAKEIAPEYSNVDPFLLKAKEFILANLEDEAFNVTQLCEMLHISRAQLHRKIIALTGQPTTSLIRSIRMVKAQELLSTGQFNVSEVAYQVGFKTQAHFSRVFAETFGMPPSDYRRM